MTKTNRQFLRNGCFPFIGRVTTLSLGVYSYTDTTQLILGAIKQWVSYDYSLTKKNCPTRWVGLNWAGVEMQKGDDAEPQTEKKQMDVTNKAILLEGRGGQSRLIKTV